MARPRDPSRPSQTGTLSKRTRSKQKVLTSRSNSYVVMGMRRGTLGTSASIAVTPPALAMLTSPRRLSSPPPLFAANAQATPPGRKESPGVLTLSPAMRERACPLWSPSPLIGVFSY
jgi:hypothetical protein